MARKQFRVITGEGEREGQFTGEVVLVNEDGSDWAPGEGGGPIVVADVEGLQAILDGLEQRVSTLEGGGDAA